MKVAVFVLGIVSVALASPPGISTRVLGGLDTVEGHGAFEVAIYKNNYKFVGTGTIIDEKNVLTSAQLMRHNCKNMYIHAGNNNLNKQTKKYKVVHCVAHEDFNNETLGNDIAIMTIDKRFIFKAGVLAPGKLDPTPIGAGVNVTLVGWGTTNYLEYVHLWTISIDECKLLRPTVTEKQICTVGSADNKAGEGFCKGDAGGSLAFLNMTNLTPSESKICPPDGEVEQQYYCETNPDGSKMYIGWNMIGIASYGGCGDGKPDVSTRLTSYLPWIKKHTSK